MHPNDIQRLAKKGKNDMINEHENDINQDHKSKSKN
jgi:hypothetical protein